MNEEALLRKIFGDDQKWQGKHAIYNLDWCALCRTASIHNPNCDCHGSSCNAGGCKFCREDFDVFHKCKTTVREYLTEQECAAHDKALRLIKWILESLTLGEQEIDWKRLKTTGQTSRNDDEVFKDRFQPEWNFDYEPNKKKNDPELHSRMGHAEGQEEMVQANENVQENPKGNPKGKGTCCGSQCDCRKDGSDTSVS